MKIERKIINNLISLQEYAKIRHKKPYLFNFFKGEQEILYLGVEHSKNPKNRQFKFVEKSFRGFLRRHKNNEITLFLECLVSPLINNRNKMIARFGETGLVYFMSAKEKLAIVCPEPSQKQILDFVKSRKHNIADILLWIFINVLYNKFMISKKKRITKKIFKELFIIIKKISKVYTELKLEKEFTKHLQKILGNKEEKTLFQIINNLKLKELKKLQNPFIYYSNLNKVGADFNLARDYFLSKTIINYFNKGKSIFAVFGINHPVCQKKAILTEIKRPRHKQLSRPPTSG